MQNTEFDVYDIDGTLTVPGHDLWYLCTRNLCADKDRFDECVVRWKREMQSGLDPFDSSLRMMNNGLALLKYGVDATSVTAEVRRIAIDLVDEGLVWPEAIHFLNGRLRRGVGAVFSTTNYQAGALGFLAALKSKDIIQEPDSARIFVSGSHIDWTSRSITHFNMGGNKVIGLSKTLGVSEEMVKAKIDYAFGDDPAASDRELLAIARRSYVIRNESHRGLSLPERIRLVSWSEIPASSAYQ
jgi:hypothetical protein